MASKDHGATIVKETGVMNGKALLSKSKDEYLQIKDCQKNIEINSEMVIRLAEAVTVESIMISNHEEFADNLYEI